MLDLEGILNPVTGVSIRKRRERYTPRQTGREEDTESQEQR